MNLYVGNLPYSLGDQELKELFTPFGDVRTARVMMDRETGRSRGFGFIEMDDAAAQQAVAARNGFDVGGRALVVNEARPREERPRFGGPRPSGGGGGGYSGGGGGGGGAGAGRGGDWRPKGGQKSRRPRVEEDDFRRDEY